MGFLPTDQKQQRIVMIGIVGLLLAFGFYWFRYRSQVTLITEKEANIMTLTDTKTSLMNTLARNGGNLQPRLAMLEQHIKRLEQLIPRQQDVPNLLSAIAQEAINANVIYGGITPQPTEASAYYNREVYEMMVTGDYHSIGNYLAGIASLPRIIKAGNMRLMVDAEARPRADGRPMLRANFTIETYVIPAAQPLPGDTTGVGI